MNKNIIHIDIEVEEESFEFLKRLCQEILDCMEEISMEEGLQEEEGEPMFSVIQGGRAVAPIQPIKPTGEVEKKKTENDTVTLFTTGCPKCTVLKQKLQSKNISFSENNNKEQMEKLGIKQVPVLKVGEKLLHFAEANNWINKHTM